MLVTNLMFFNEVKQMIVPIKVTDEGEHYFEIPEQYLKELGWSAGDIVIWTQTMMVAFHLLSLKVNRRLV